MAKVVAVIGKKKSGKTATVEFLISHLTKDGFKVGALKHTHHHDFTFDTKGKDTWRFAQAGAKTVIGVSNSEVAVINKTTTLQQSLDRLLALFKEELDFIILEGFHTLVSDRKDVYKIITAFDEEELHQTIVGTSPPIIAITGNVAAKLKTLVMNIPVIDIKAEGEKLVELVKAL